MTIEEMDAVLACVEFKDYSLTIHCGADDSNPYLQGSYLDYDYYKKADELQFTRKWNVSQHMTKSELVQTAFKLCMTSFEHRCREAFKYKGKRIYGPHFDADALWAICKDANLDYRRD